MDHPQHPARDTRPSIWPALAFVVAVVRTAVDVWQLFEK